MVWLVSQLQPTPHALKIFDQLVGELLLKTLNRIYSMQDVRVLYRNVVVVLSNKYGNKKKKK